MTSIALDPTHDSNLRDSTRARTAGTSKKRLWASRVLSGLAVLFLAMDAGMKLLMLPVVVQGSAELGFSAPSVFALGVVLLGCVVLYAIPRTAVLGAVLLTGYLGGAIATHVRAGNPLVSHTLFPIYVAVFVWGALYLRDARVRALLGPARARPIAV